jgi:hypothetical protein
MALSILTEKTTSIGSHSIYANSLVDGLDSATAIFVYFEYKKSTETQYSTTTLITYEGVGSYSELIEGLIPSTLYDVRAVVNDGTTTARGEVVQCLMLSNLNDRAAANYDILIAKTKATLNIEKDANRIDNAYYAKSLLATMQSTMTLAYNMAVKEGTIDESEILLQKQIEAQQADIELKVTQKIALIKATIYNNKIHGLDSLAAMVGTGMAGQVIVPKEVLQKVMDMVAELDGTEKVTVTALPTVILV